MKNRIKLPNVFICIIISLLLICLITGLYKYILCEKENFNNQLFPLQFVHIPKNAGVSIEKAGASKGILWGYRRITKRGITDKKNTI